MRVSVTFPGQKKNIFQNVAPLEISNIFFLDSHLMLALQTMQTSKPIPSTLSTLPNKHLDYEINCEQLNTRSTQLYRVYKIQDLNPHLSLRLLGEIFTLTRTLRRRECTIIKKNPMLWSRQRYNIFAIKTLWWKLIMKI